MEALQNRIDSFKKPKRAKNPSKASSYASVKWPHPNSFAANPETLAEAGFYFNPTFNDRDNVTCYMCETKHRGWKADDDPFDVHWDECGTSCCWASVRCGLRRDMDQDGSFVFVDKSRLPTSKTMERARLGTFDAGDGWVHDREKNHGASSRNMARAGFVYSPSAPGDDLATCLYCNVSLSGWEADDDPTEEHRKRDTKNGTHCPFLASEAALTTKTSSRVQSKPQFKSAPKSRATSVTKSKELPVPVSSDVSDDEPDIVPSSSNKRSARGRTPSAPSTAKSSRKTATAFNKRKLGDVVEDNENVEGDDEEVVPSKPQKARRTTTVTKVKGQVLEETNNEEQAIPRKATSRTRSKPSNDGDDGIEQEEPKLRKSTRGKQSSRPASKGRSQKKKALPESDTDGIEEKRGKNQKAKPSPVSEEEAEDVDAEPRRPKGKQLSSSRAKKPPRIGSKVAVSASEGDDLDIILPAKNRTAAKVEIVTTGSVHSKSKVVATPIKEETDMDVIKTPEDMVVSQHDTNIPVLLSNPRRSPLAKTNAKDQRTQTNERDKLPSSSGSNRSPGKPVRAGAIDIDEGGDTEMPNGAPKTATDAKSSPPMHRPQSRPKLEQKSAKGKVSILKVVEISTDEEDEMVPVGDHAVQVTPGKATNAPPISNDQQLQYPTEEIAVNSVSVLPAQVQLPRQPLIMASGSVDTIPEDAEMANAKMLEKPNDAVGLPVKENDLPPLTSKRDKAVVQPVADMNLEINAPSPAPLFCPPLSKLPFMPLQNLTEAELEMTVEEWVKYQMEVEYDKFRRDGERELARFRKRAEEVRKTIEEL